MSSGHPGTTGEHARRRDIEGLRAVAVLLVVAYHCGVSVVGGGYVGVDVFFVISGFLITGLLLREIRGTGRLNLPGFYARRILRLLPAATVVVVCTVAAAVWLLPPLRHRGVLLDALHTLVSGVNYRLAVIGTDYLAGVDPSPLQHFWSLAVEEQFYLLWPLVLLASARVRRAPAVLLVLVAGGLALSVWQTLANGTWAYFGAHTRAWELGVGALLAVHADRLAGLGRRAARRLADGGLIAIVLAAVLYSDTTPFPGYAALLPVLGAAAFIAGGTAVAGGVAGESSRLGGAVWQSVGRLSYSWYLWHWPFLALLPAALGHPGAWWQRVLAAALAFLAAMLTYALVENPVRHLAALRRRPRRAILAGAVTSAVAAGLCVLLVAVAAWTADTPTFRAAPERVDGSVADLQQALARGAALRAVPANLTPPLAEADADETLPHHDGCDSGVTNTRVQTPCTYGDTAATTTVVLFGDSHAGHWFPALDRIARQRHWRLVVVTKSACSAADSVIYYKMVRRAFTECVDWRKAAWQRIRALRPAMVVMSSVGTGDMLHADDQDEAWAAGWARSVVRVSGPSTRVVVLADTPWQAGDVPDCLSAHLTTPGACVAPRADAVLLPRRRLLVAAAVRARGAQVIDPTPWFCTATACPVMVGNVLVFRDGHHMTTAYARMLTPLLAGALPG
ncbi:acyltransferase [Mangrovihabitans endophyticus]|uniref:Acyltransferase n=1 Tax=Mangrovihabitans endophyticus TaxID=1751298 RepID=A0A8J3FN75_9ACTN|nr:acyltransferase [Mangrovihabitans endophyticus]